MFKSTVLKIKQCSEDQTTCYKNNIDLLHAIQFSTEISLQFPEFWTNIV